MKNTMKCFRFIAIVAVIGMTGCDNGNSDTVSSSGGGGGNPGGVVYSFKGTWYGYDPAGERIQLAIGNTDWTMSWPEDLDKEPLSGIYTYEGNRAVVTDTDGYAMGTAAVSELKLTVIITGQRPFVLVKPSKSSSVDDFADLEPNMEDNSNRKTVQKDRTLQIGIPGNLSGLGGNAQFAIDPADGNIATITSQDGNTCTIKGNQLGSVRIRVTVGGQTSTITVAIVPNLPSYTLPEGEEITLGEGDSSDPWWADNNNRPDTISDLQNYQSEPTYQLAWVWRNPSTSLGASGTNCGIDILAYYVDPANGNKRGFVRTTFGYGGWHYDLNGVTNTMTDGVQTNGNVELKLQPGFYYDKGVPYLQIVHILTNKGATRLTGQKFGASADIMIHGNDSAPLTYLQYGALMTNQTGSAPPSLKLRLVCQNVQGVDDVSTLWLGNYGSERSHVYDNQRTDISGRDSALNFSYQNIDLNPGESKRFVVRFTQVQ